VIRTGRTTSGMRTLCVLSVHVTDPNEYVSNAAVDVAVNDTVKVAVAPAPSFS
jgi:hypothetical protein